MLRILATRGWQATGLLGTVVGSIVRTSLSSQEVVAVGGVGTAMSVAEVLTMPLDQPVVPARHLWASGDLHGGLTLALLIRTLRSAVPDGALIDATAQFHRPVRGPFVLNHSQVRHGTATTAVAATAWTARGVIASANALFAGSVSPARAHRSAPDVAPPDAHQASGYPDGETLVTPHIETRILTSDDQRGSLAWARLAGEDRPPDLLRLVVLLGLRRPGEATAVAGQPLATAVRPSTGLSTTASPWVLLESRTTVTSTGWVEHHVDAWDPDRNHLGAARHLSLAQATTD